MVAAEYTLPMCIGGSYGGGALQYALHGKRTSACLSKFLVRVASNDPTPTLPRLREKPSLSNCAMTLPRTS